MEKKHISEVERIENKNEGFKGMHQRFVWTKDDGVKNFAMRLMEFEPFGHTSYHSHQEEHEFLFVEGEPGFVDSKGNEIRLEIGNTIYVPPNEPHQVKNLGNSVMKMVCMIPILPGGDGKAPAPNSRGKGYVTERPKGC